MAEIAELGPEGSGNRVAKDLFSGAVGGIAQVLIGQPFDIVKVRLQTSTAVPQPSALQTAKQILETEGATAFYKGTLTPLLGIGACVSVQFGAFHYFKRLLSSNPHPPTTTPTTTTDIPTITYPALFLAGALSGLANTPLSTPIEHIRIRLQTQPHTPPSARLYSGPLHCIRTISSQAGILQGLYRGFSVTALREAAAYGSWFCTFEYLMNGDAARNGISRKEVPTWKVAGYGGLAGEMLWLSSYPFDVVKSRMQCDGFGMSQRYSGMRDCFAQVFRESGVGGFWKGIGPTLLRAMPVSAGTFVVVEMTMRALG